MSNTPSDQPDFATQAAMRTRGPVGEFCDFMMHNKKWWLFPIILVLLVLGIVVVLGGTGIAPFIYTLF